jgi:hypothetical protein
MTEGQRIKRSWRNFLLDARYQVTFTLPMVLLAGALFAGLGYVAMKKAETATKIGINQIEETGSAYLENAEETRAALLRRERSIDIGIVIVGVLLCLGLAMYGVVLSHRVAGPLYRLNLELNKLRDGKLEPATALRKGDHLIELYDAFRGASAAVREREQREVEILRQAIAAAEESGIAAEQIEPLRARLSAKEVALG